MITNHILTILKRHWFNDEIYELHCSKPDGFIFLPGQFIHLRYLDMEREYTLISAPDEPVLRLLIKRMPEGRLSVALAELAIGSEIALSAAQGYFCYQPSEREACFIATGTGIAPFIAMWAGGLSGFTLLHGVSHPSALVYRQELSAAAKRYVPCLSSAAAMEGDPPPFRGYVGAYVETMLPADNYDFYLCGRRSMIHDLTHLLDARYPDARIYSEAYD
ncbi:MAG: FAD-binding oxidoreductase [bacterium]|nr:FAD-binding oxidoreductase [bacterium]